jgi:hypothetical protein
MAKFPEPPAPSQLASLGPSISLIPAGTTIWRIFFLGGAHPTSWDQFRSWGPTDARFDHHLPPASSQPRQILYGAIGSKGGLTALAEVFQETRVVDRAWKAPCLVAFVMTADLHLLDLTGTWPTLAGASMVIASGRRDRARRWSQAIYAAFPAVDGILYGSSMNANEPCLALYERAIRAMPANPIANRQLTDPNLRTLLKNACVDLNYVLV